MGTIIRLGKPKLNDFSIGEAKIGEKQSRQSNSKYNFLQHVFFGKKGVQSVQWGLGQSWEIFDDVGRLLLTASYRKMGDQDVQVVPQ